MAMYINDTLETIRQVERLKDAPGMRGIGVGKDPALLRQAHQKLCSWGAGDR